MDDGCLEHELQIIQKLHQKLTMTQKQFFQSASQKIELDQLSKPPKFGENGEIWGTLVT